ncbi:hypothetical protein BE21_54585 [Sorangium cellulosum]|uniref:Uncharacterized protein n=1 Tax=Sorangium cellulosum TaxID=56 RepID=A0A150TDB7_SORCE|nr:hypothetical protein BE21_54585 [Sorangium cellulosum]
MIAVLGTVLALTGCVAEAGDELDALSAEDAQGEVEGTGEAGQALEMSPLSAEQRTNITDSGARTMYTEATLQRGGDHAGQLYARTVTRNAVKLNGFTGGVFIVLRNDDGAVVGVSGLHTYGVDGKWVGTYVRDEIWIENFEPQVAAAATQLEIVQQRASTDRLPEIEERIQQFKRLGCQLVNVPRVCG